MKKSSKLWLQIPIMKRERCCRTEVSFAPFLFIVHYINIASFSGYLHCRYILGQQKTSWFYVKFSPPNPPPLKLTDFSYVLLFIFILLHNLLKLISFHKVSPFSISHYLLSTVHGRLINMYVTHHVFCLHFSMSCDTLL